MRIFYVLLLFVLTVGCQSQPQNKQPVSINKNNVTMEKATLAGGCFWCTEALFQDLKGVKKVTSGYTGGTVENPTYQEVCTGETGHAEAVEIEFDPNEISFGTLLELFFATHDPTTLNRQGEDVGTQYRSEIFYHNATQKQLAEDYIQLLNQENTYGKPVVTKVSPATVFYPAEDYHQNYYNLNKTKNPYCFYTITPKVEKLKKKYSDKLK